MDIENLTIEQLAELRDRGALILGEKVAARQKELQAELERVGGLTESNKKRAVKYRDGTNEWSGTAEAVRIG